MNNNRRRLRGFTLGECLVSIAILSIAISGVLAALAFDVTSSEQNGALTFANSYNRKILDLIQNNQLDYKAISVVGTWPPQPASITAPLDGTNWKKLDGDALLATGGGVTNFWGAPGSVEFQRWQIEKERYHTNIVSARVVENFGSVASGERFKNLLVEILITTRWANKGSWRSTQLRGFTTTSEQK